MKPVTDCKNCKELIDWVLEFNAKEMTQLGTEDDTPLMPCGRSKREVYKLRERKMLSLVRDCDPDFVDRCLGQS